MLRFYRDAGPLASILYCITYVAVYSFGISAPVYECRCANKYAKFIIISTTLPKNLPAKVTGNLGLEPFIVKSRYWAVKRFGNPVLNCKQAKFGLNFFSFDG